nr:MAG TPA: Prohead core protein serine protease [Caudoviricetes sp.]
MTEKNYFNSIWESKKGSGFQILQESEGNSVVDGVHILARVSGPSFFPDTTSRNNVHYPKEAWENAINDPEFQERLQNKLVFGTIGHDPEMTDNEVRNGIHSHIVSKVWIDENNIGMAEYLILNTEPGRVLNTLLRAGSRVSVSTRAYGGIQEDKSPTGAEIVDPTDFSLERIDFVIDPGYKQAKPILQEQNNKENKTQEDNTMADVNVITEQLEKQVSFLTEQYNLSAKDAKELQKALTEAKVNEAANKVELEGYRALGTMAKLQEAVTKLAKFEELSEDPEELEKNLEEGAETIEELTAEIERLQALKAELEAKVTENDQVGTDLEQTKTQLAEFDDLGSAEEIRDLLSTVEEVQEELDQYRELGTVDEIKDAFEKIEKFAEESEQAELQDLADEYGADAEAINLLKSKGLSVEEIETVLDGVATVEGDADVDITEEDSEDEETEDDDEEEVLGESLSSATLRRLSRMKRIAESKGKSGNRKMAGKKSFKESRNVNAGSNRLLSKLIKA